ncbi:hypothetical protein HpBT112_11410 [Helicobacter pylori]
MPKKELLKMSKKRIFKDFLKEAKQHRPIVFYTDNDCDGMLAGSVLMSMCYRLGIKDFFFFSPLRNAHGYGFTDLAINDLLSKPCIFNPKTNQLVRLDCIKNQFQKDPLLFSADLGADLAADTQLQEILLGRFEQCIITDHHKSFEVDLIDKNKIAYINLNDEKDANYYSGAFTSALVFSQIFQAQNTPLENELIAITLLSDPRLSVFNVKEFKRYNDIKKKMVKESEENAQIFSCNKILVALLDESCSVKLGISGLVANNFLKKYSSNRSLCIYRDNKDGYKRFVKEIIGSEKASKTKNSALEVSNTKASAIKNETTGSGDLKKVCEKIKSALPFGIISAFKPFKDAFYRDFNDNEQKLLIGAAKSGCIQSSSDKLAQLKTRLLYWQDKSVKVDWDKPIGIKDFFKGNDYLYRKFCSLLGKHFMDRFLKNNAKASVKDFISSKEFVAKYRYTPKQHTERAKKLQSYLESKRDFIGFVQTLNSLKDNPQDPFLPNEETSFLVFSNEPTIVFNLRDYLLVLAQIFNQQAICYCESKCPIELINASPGKDFNKAQDSFSDIKFSTPNQLEQSLNALKNKLSAFFSNHPDKHNGMEFNEIAKT